MASHRRTGQDTRSDDSWTGYTIEAKNRSNICRRRFPVMIKSWRVPILIAAYVLAMALNRTSAFETTGFWVAVVFCGILDIVEMGATSKPSGTHPSVTRAN